VRAASASGNEVLTAQARSTSSTARTVAASSALRAVLDEHAVNGVGRDRLGEFGVGSPVAPARTLQTGTCVIPRHQGERGGMPPYADAKGLNLPFTWILALWTVS
jgi:hypothetical protein